MNSPVCLPLGMSGGGRHGIPGDTQEECILESILVEKQLQLLDLLKKFRSPNYETTGRARPTGNAQQVIIPNSLSH